MAIIIRNLTASPVDINDLGVRIPASADVDVEYKGIAHVLDSADTIVFINAGTLALLDPDDGVTELSIAQAGARFSGTDSSPFSTKLKISANDSTPDYLGAKIVGVSDETAIAEVNDGDNEDLAVGIADNVILPGVASVTVPSGTEVQRPGSPAAGMMRFNDDADLMEYYNGTEWISITGTSTGPGTLTGSIVGYHFLLDKFEYDVWLGTTTKHITSDEVQYVMPFDAEIVAITYGGNIIDADIELSIEVAGPTDGASNTTAFTWTLNDVRVARISTPVGSGGPGGFVLEAGSKIGIFAADPGGGTPPDEVVVSIYIQWTDEGEEEASENYAGDFT
jgi:hypothetical protein